MSRGKGQCLMGRLVHTVLTIPYEAIWGAYGMKKYDGPSQSWPTPHTTPLFLPPEDPSPVLLRPNSIPE